MPNDEENVPAPIFGNTQIQVTDALLKALESTDGEGGRMGDMSFMSFSGKRGIYKIGTDGREPEEDEPFLVAIPMFELGWMCWKGGKPVAKRMANISQPKIPDPDLSEFGPFDDKKGEGWAKARAITARSMKHDEQVYFSNNSKSGVAEMSDLQSAVLERMRSGQPCWPVVVFGKEEFEAQGFKNFKPTITAVQWLDTEKVNMLADPEIDPMDLLDDNDDDPEPPKEDKAEAPRPRRRRI